MEISMLSASLRRSGGSLILTIPQAYAEQNNLEAGTKMALEIEGAELRLRPARRKRSLTELLDATPNGLHRVQGWDEMPSAGKEL
jgi:antitoxin ChpS